MRLMTWTALAALASAAQAAPACEYPTQRVKIPNGTVASAEEMLSAKQQVEEFVAAMETYLACLDTKLQSTDAGLTEEQRAIDSKRYNAAVDQMHITAELFNAQLRIFRDR